MDNKKINLRSATSADTERVFSWRNDPWIVSLSKSGKKIDWEGHKNWFEKQLKTPLSCLYIVEGNDGNEMGLVRFQPDIDENEAYSQVTIYLLRPYTGDGNGVKVLQQGCQAMFDANTKIQEIRAEILATNIASIKTFAKVGFKPFSQSGKINKEKEIVNMVLMRTTSHE